MVMRRGGVQKGGCSTLTSGGYVLYPAQAACLASARLVVASDGHPDVLSALAENVARNGYTLDGTDLGGGAGAGASSSAPADGGSGARGSICVRRLRWGDGGDICAVKGMAGPVRPPLLLPPHCCHRPALAPFLTCAPEAPRLQPLERAEPPLLSHLFLHLCFALLRFGSDACGVSPRLTSQAGFDVIVGADLVYERSALPPLFSTAAELLAPGAHARALAATRSADLKRAQRENGSGGV